MQMKKLNYSFLLIFFTITLFNCSSKNTKQSAKSIENLHQSFAKSDAEAITDWLEDPVEIRLPGQLKSSYSKTQATHILHNFFDKYKAVDFQKINQSNSPSAQFLVGKYVHNTGSFRVYLQLNKQESQYQIASIDFNVD